MDGVIVDLHKHFELNPVPGDEAWHIPGVDWDAFDFSQLDWTPWGKELLAWCKSLDQVTFLSAGGNGKDVWVKTHAPGVKLICDPEKWKYGSSSDILIDDKTENILLWPGEGILVPAHWNRLHGFPCFWVRGRRFNVQ